MYRYRFHIRDVAGGTVDEAAREFSGDLDALDHAKALAKQHIIEIWEGMRRVARVKPGDAGPLPTDAEPN